MGIRISGTSVFLLVLAGLPARADFRFLFDSNTQRWDLSNGVVHSVFQLGTDGKFLFKQVDDLEGGHVWAAPDGVPTSPIRVRFNTTTYDATVAYRLVSQQVETPNAATSRQVITLQDLTGAVEIKLELEMYDRQPVLRHRVSATNLTLKTVHATLADMLPYNFVDAGQAYRLWRVNQWAVVPKQVDFQTSQVALNPNGAAVSLMTGANGAYCAWFALSDPNKRGLFAGWEFDGQAQATVRHLSPDRYVQLGTTIPRLYHPVLPGQTFHVPGAFLGLYQGNWDEAGYRTQAFSESVLAQPAPDSFPYVAWDSWGYAQNLQEDILRRNADAAAKLGMELFIVDLGWAKQIGDWQEDLQKFPSGLRALSEYVHSLGMKFGLHFALAETMASSPVLEANPDWTSTESDNYSGALSLCLSNKPTQQWLIDQALSMIDNYNVDWILQDGQNMVKHCTKTTHTHDPHDSNYSNSVDGINAVVEAIQRARPNVMWENCENGGNMQTFNMLSHYVTSITNDASGALGSRQGVYGSTYPFPTRYADRYEPEEPSTTYITRSYMFGGPWHFMNQLTEMSADASMLAASEIQVYKNIRAHIKSGKVFHITSAPAAGRVDALESYTPSDDTAIAIVTRNGTAADYAVIRLQGLSVDKTYKVHFQDDTRVLSMTGLQLSTTGVRVNLPQSQIAEIVYVDPL